MPGDMNPNVDRPAHYDGDACMVAIEQLGIGLGMCLGNAVKYLWRQGKKHERVREDAEKAKWYLARARGYGPLATKTLRRIGALEAMANEVLAALDSDSTIPDLRERLTQLADA